MWRLGHRPALDGLRGIAVLLVVVFHMAGPSYPAGGLVGVTVFFVLSGFLITSLMLEEGERVNLSRFYIRRARRLLPALAVMLPIAGLLGIALGTTTPAGMLSVAGYSSNIYAATGRGLGPLQHLWTLSAEEQFYILWPLALGFVVRWRRPAAMLGSLVAVVMLARLAFSAAGVSETVVYYTSGEAILAGAALAFWFRGRTVKPAPAWSLVALVALMVAAGWMHWPAAVKTGLVTVLAVALVYAIASGATTRLLTWAPIRTVGRTSYGLYLWHLPAIQFAWVVGAHAGLTYWQAMPFAAALMAGLTASSWRLVEQPFLRRNSADAEPVERAPSRVRAEVRHVDAQLVRRGGE